MVSSRAWRVVPSTYSITRKWTPAPWQTSCVRTLFEFLSLPLRRTELDLSGRRNKNQKKTTITDEARREFDAVLEAMPSQYLEIFRREPYTRMPWINLLR